MLHERVEIIAASLGSGLLQRATLVLNHVLSRESVAMRKLAAHAGARIELRLAPMAWAARLAPMSWAERLARPAPFVWQVTPAGLLDADTAGFAPAPKALEIDVDMADPLGFLQALLDGRRPPLRIHGDAALAADVDWLFDHVRWDPADDLQPLIGPAAAHGVARAGALAAAVSRRAVAALQALAPRGAAARR